MRLNRLALLPVTGLLAATVGAIATPHAAAVAERVMPQGRRTAHTVTLLTGDRVMVSRVANGKPQVTVAPAVKRSSFQIMTLGSHTYVVPQAAAGFLGAPLDLSLFDVTALAADGYTSPAKPLRVSISYAHGSSARALPGIRLTGQGTGALDHAGELRFGEALAACSRSLRSASPRDRLFRGITRISLSGITRAGPAAAAATTGATGADAPTATTNSTAGRLYNLTIKGFDRTGRAANSTFAYVMNLDDSNNFLAGQIFFRGIVKYSVPAGHYEIASFIPTVHPDGTLDFSLVTDPQATVSHDTVVVLDARKANRLSVTAPDPTRTVIAELSLQRSPAAGPDLTTVFLTFDDTPLYATPTAPVSEGQLYFYPYFRLGDDSGSIENYVYDLEFPYSGAIPEDLTQTVARSQLATVDARYHSPYPGRPEYDVRAGVMPWQDSASFGAGSLTAPLARTEYLLPQPGMTWFHELITDEQDFLGNAQDIVRAYRPGDHVTEDWLAQPMPPGVPDEVTAGEPCPACRVGDTLSLTLVPYLDTGGHFQLPDASGSTDLALYQDGSLVGDQPSSLAQFPMSPSPASYKLVLDQSRNVPWWPTTTHTNTTWTWTSQERPAGQLPSGWTCPPTGGGGKAAKGGGGGGGGTASGCSFEPLLFIGYQTNAGLDDVVPAGQQATVDVTIGHQFGAPSTPITSVAAQVSFDDGATWTAVTPTQTSDGQYQLVYDQPSLDHSSGFASLRVTAADADGSAIDQTITHAYPLSVLNPPSGLASGGSTPGTRRACAGWVAAPYAQCMAIVNTAAPAAARDGTPSGYGPADIQSAYNLPDSGAGQTVAVVDAYDDPNAEADLAAYRAKYGLSPCTTGNGCFTKVNQDGKAGPLPSPDPGWGVEISLDLDAVSATCPNCHIMLVEANSSSIFDLGKSVNTAVALGANAVSNSYGSMGEFSAEQYFERFYDHPGVPIVASSGDYGYGNGRLLINSVGFPAASRYVIAVGGTSLTRDASASRGWTESAWSGATSGCSAYIHKPGWQRDMLCRNRTVADVAAVADPKTGLAVYDSFGWGGWLEIGGTSASSPVIAGVYALAGNGATQRYAFGLYKDPSHLFDITAGANGDNCSNTYLCTAVPGYDGPTGLGTPNGAGSF